MGTILQKIIESLRFYVDNYQVKAI